MTEAALSSALADAVSQTLETMCFTSCLGEAVREGSPRPEIAVQLAFEGRPPGRFTLRAPEAAARSIAAGFVGEDEDAITERQVGEVLRELANMVCGCVLSRVESAEEFRLGEPRLVPAAELERRAGAVAQAVETGGGALEAVLEMENPEWGPSQESAS